MAVVEAALEKRANVWEVTSLKPQIGMKKGGVKACSCTSVRQSVSMLVIPSFSKQPATTKVFDCVNT